MLLFDEIKRHHWKGTSHDEKWEQHDTSKESAFGFCVLCCSTDFATT